jgi:hypothetical protein
MDPITLAIFGVSALLGGGMGVWSAARQSRDEQDRLRRQQAQAWEKYELGKAYSDNQYAINRDEAQVNLALQARRLDEDVGSSVDQFNSGLLGQAYGIQNAQIQTASGIGASRAAEGMSGTRGNGANELMRAYEQNSLDRNIGLQYRQNDQAMAGMIGQANRGMADIGRERASWEPGGYRYQSKTAQDEYNRDLALSGQSDFDWAIGNAAMGPEDWALGFFGGASSGLGLGASAVNALNVSGWGGSADQAAVNAGFRSVYSDFSSQAGPGFDTFNYGLVPPKSLQAPNWFDGLNMDFWS